VHGRQQQQIVDRAGECQKADGGFAARRVTIGPTNVLDPDQAWERARLILSEIYGGKDPKVEAKRQKRVGLTVAPSLDDYLAKSDLAASTVQLYRETAQRHLTPWLQRLLRSITRQDVADLFAAITDDVAARRAAGSIIGGVNVDGRATANLALQLFRSLWVYESEREEDEELPEEQRLPPNPVNRLKRRWHKIDSRDRRIQSTDLPAFYQAALQLPNKIQRDLILFCLFTGMRQINCTTLRWTDVDLPQRLIRIRAVRMKNRKIFELPMSDYVHDLLVARRAVGYDGPFVFPGLGEKGYSQSFTFALMQIAENTGIRVSPHDLRRTFVSIAQNCNGVSAAAGSLLVHHTAGSGVTANYTHLELPELRQAAQRVTNRIKELCQIEPLLQGENVARLG
jgi:integrase